MSDDTWLGNDPRLDQDRLTQWCDNALPVPRFAQGGGSKRQRDEIPDRPMRQGQVWKKIRDAFWVLYPDGHIVRVEDWVGRGTPDVYYRIVPDIRKHCGPGWSGWLELKTGYDKLTDLQLAWHQKERKAGGRVVVLTIRPNKAILDFGEGPEDWGVLKWAVIVAKL